MQRISFENHAKKNDKVAFWKFHTALWWNDEVRTCEGNMGE